VKVANTGTGTVGAWSLVWTFANGQQITQIWNATDTQAGATVTAVNLSYNGTIGPGGSTSFGFLGSWTTANAKPTAFTLNGNACTVG
jgi:cellulase/cellobiase CelA1